ncbi:MAG: hypothetical protein J2P28_08160 [Actinobacteria bacterium]|nr:hypothetical protein [Actinomycetota bacterium]
MTSNPGTKPGSGGGQAQPSARSRQAQAVAGHVALFLVGLVQGLIGIFQYSRGPGVLMAVVFDVVILATCVLGSWGMRTALGGVLPAIGWFIVTFVLSSSSAGGSVFVTNTPAGATFLFGGAICAAAGAVYAFAAWSSASRERRANRARKPPA